MKIINVFVIYTTVDEYDRRGNLVIVTPDELLADTYNEKAGWYGGLGYKQERKAIKAGKDTYFLIDDEVNYPIRLNEKFGSAEEKLKRNALKKLTKAEKELLGLGDE